MALPVLVALTLWAALTGVDLVAWPQQLFSRPVVAASGAGLLLGDLEAGFRVGVLLELFALEVLPIGAVKYPDYAGASVAGTVVAAGNPWTETLGAAVILSLSLAMISQPLIDYGRRANARAVHRLAGELEHGNAAVLARLQHGGLLREFLRAVLTGVVGVAAAVMLRNAIPGTPLAAQPLALLAVAGGAAAGLHGMVRIAGQGDRTLWLAAGAVVGFTMVLFL